MYAFGLEGSHGAVAEPAAQYVSNSLFPQHRNPVSYVHVFESTSAMDLPELLNSSLHTSVPEPRLSAKSFEAAVLFEYPEAAAIAFTVRFDEIRNGAKYCIDVFVGVEPSSV
jgi:hypothetical protein